MIVPCQAEEQPKLELFSGYSYMHSGLTGGGQDHPKLNGWDASLARNVNSWFSMKADFGGHYGSTDVQVPIPVTICPPACLPPISVNTNTHEFLFGPQFTYRTRTARVFAHALIGAEHVSVNSRLPIPFPVPPLIVSRAETSFATAIGGGIDLGSGRL